ncbi:transferrin [Eupeodes corollae]|uniref:transferrin n=1 Tax=Eupeodes corollae TaxID=290404 RepID=UPI0024936E73|nr:transferrin [Eupeodes corollae]
MLASKLTQTFLVLAFVAAVCSASSVQNEQIYKMCVPEKFYQDCLDLLKDPSEAGIHMECVKGRDRLECLDLINQRKADVLAADPEDMYVAYHKKNEDYKVISEFRTQVEKDAEFRYEGVILVKKNSNIHSLKELQGAKSCHTGYGRNVGYKIPITKLKNTGILKVSMDPKLSSTERELKALSDFFSQSCLVGTLSPQPEINQALRKKYSNLCALCEDPVKCNYPDKFSGYDGAIRCLDKGKGDVAFTKTSFIKKYFGLIDGTKAESTDTANFEYLCEDGTRRPITGPACSWAQRPWKGYISNTDTVKEKSALERLQTRLEKFFTNGLKAENKKAAADLLIEPDLVYHNKEKIVDPKEYLERAGYKDVIERDGSAINKIRLCVSQDIEMKKCKAMLRAAYSRDIRPELECVLSDDCVKAVKDSKADAAVIKPGQVQTARDQHLQPLAYETILENNLYVVVVDPSLSKDILTKSPVKFDASQERARAAAALLSKKRGKSPCEVQSSPNDKMMIVKANELNNYKNMQLLCPNMEKKAISEVATCNFEAALPRTVMVRESMDKIEKDNIIHVCSLLSEKFGGLGKLNDVFEMFGEFEQGNKDVIFTDDGKSLETEWKNTNVDEKTAMELRCGNAISKS